jgi:hypothetical protein
MRQLTCANLIALTVAMPLTAALAQSCNTADRSILLILDASGSMVARLPSGESRIDIARRAIKGVAAQVPAQAQLSLRLYGAQSPARQKNCQDTNMAVPFGPAGGTSGAIAVAVDSATAQGYTPIAHALQEAAKDFPATAKERVIVLVSDGKETCQGDPAVAAKALATSGITVHTVGFIVDTAARGQLQVIARATGGRYFDAPVGPELPDTLKKALNACKQTVAKVPPKPQPGKLRTTSATWLASHAVLNAETGQKVGTLDSASREIALPAGIYEVKFGAGSWKGIEIRSGETTTIEPGQIKLDPTAGATVIDSETGEKHGSFDRMSSAVTLMPGVYDVRLGKSAWSFIKVDGGKTVTLRPAQVKLARDLKWQKARVLTADGAEVFRFDAVTREAVLVPGNYVVEVDGRTITFNAAEGQVLDVKAQ